MAQFLFIDGSYFCFYRFHALLIWWKNAHRDEPIGEPFSNTIFVEKFKKVFNEKINEIVKKLKLKKPTIIIGKDCHRKNIWRMETFPQYKENRCTDDIFLGGPFFNLAYSELFPGNNKISGIISHEKLEADDCIAIATRHVLEKDSTAQVYIITSDMDYLQLVNERTHIYNLKYKQLIESKTAFDTAEKNLFCKIVIGDKSDNIPGIFKKCGIKTAEKLFNDQDEFIKKINLESCNEEYERNKLLVDFNCIPLEYINQVKTTFEF